MNKTLLLFLFLYFISFCHGITDVDISARIKVDSLMISYFTEDEILLETANGTLLEYPDDSFWGINNDVKQLKVSWDQQFFYVELDAACWGNNVILFFDIYDDYGFTNMRDLNTWKRAFQFYGLAPEFFLATWDGNTIPQFWKVREGSTNTADQISIESYASYNTGNLDRFMIAKIPWSVFYYNDQRRMADYPTIKMIAVITGGSDNTGGPDCMPDNLGGMNNESSATAFLDNFVSVVVDSAGTNLPDMNVNPQEIRTFLKQPPLQAIPLKLTKFVFDEGKKINIGRDQVLHFRIIPNRATRMTVEIYNMKGDLVAYGSNNTPTTSADLDQNWSWDGKDQKGKKVPFGFYILRAITDNGEVSKKETVVVYQ
jgi:hypothetical protein